MKKTAVILCGGEGTRLRPYTLTIPKPLMPIGNTSILEVIIKQLKEDNFSNIILAVNYRSDLIKAYFQDGSKFGVNISYSDEEIPLGTIAPLRNIKSLPDKFLVMNGDILTDLNFGKFFDSFNHHNVFSSVSVYNKSYQIEFGVLSLDQEGFLDSFVEKPKKEQHVSMGVYCFSNKIIDLIPEYGPFGFDQLMLMALKQKLNVKCPIHNGFWLDIGRHADYEYAQDNWDQLKLKLFEDNS